MPRKPQHGLNEFDGATTSNPSAEALAQRERVAAAGEAGDLPQQQLARYGADKEGAAGSWFLPLGDKEDYVRMGWYGPEGSTKTTNLATAANHGRILVIDAEWGVKKRALQRRGVNVDNIMYWPNHEAGEKVTRRGLEKVFGNVQADLEEDRDSWYAVGFDSFTEITYLMVQGAQRRRVGRAAKSGREIDPEFLDRADYGQAAKWLAELVRKFRVLPCHLLVTALMRRDKDDDTGKVLYGPATSPAAQNDLAGMLDVLIMTKGADADGPVRGLTQATGKYRAKDRFGVAPRVLVDPTFERYLRYFNGELEEGTDPEQKRLKAKTGKASGDSELDRSEDTEEEEEEITTRSTRKPRNVLKEE